MSEQRTFVDLCLDGEVMLDEIDEFVANWHNSDSSLPLSEYLGLEPDEYAAWLEEPAVLRFIIHGRSQSIPFPAAVSKRLNMAARSADPQEAAALRKWLERKGRI